MDRPDAARATDELVEGLSGGLTWRVALEAMPDAVVVVDESGVVRDANTRAEDLIGHDRDELAGAPIEDLVPARLRSVHREHVRRFFDDPEPRSMGALRDIILVRADASERHVDVSLAPVEVAGRTWVVASLRDVTEQYRLRVEAQLARRLAEEASEEKSRFLARMSHELRTPLNAILGFAQVLEFDGLSHQRDSLAQIRIAGRHLLELIGEVLDISRVESGALGLSSEPVVVSELVDEVLDLLQPIASERGVRLDARSLEHETAVVVADRVRARQIILNLVSNAVKYNRIGGRVTLTCDAEETTVRLHVTDTGVGIAESDLARLFQPFERLAAAESDVEGTGIGLVLSQHLAAAMSGRVEATSRVGEGSVFTLTLPRATSSAAPTRRAAAALTSSPAPTPALRHRLLYVEDNLSNVRLIEQVMTRRPNWTLTHVARGGEGLAEVANGEVDVVLLDLHLPDMPGEDVLRGLRDDPRSRDLPVVVLSANAMAANIERVIALGATRYVTKPFDVLELLELLDELADPGR
ncbi:MAG TPA: ATP-binding protein [Acidimicrobiales bacterium]|nr:ATP-binding protein [Acidimicrobiales bacterium]